MSNWLGELRGDPLPWLLSPDDPAVRHAALRWLCDLAPDDPQVKAARHAAMAAPPIVNIMAAQQPQGFWDKAGPGYATKYRGTVWQLMFLDQLSADPGDPRIRAACAYVLDHTQAASGGFGSSGVQDGPPPPPSRVIHCLNGNLLRALLGFGWLDDSRVQRAIDWEARAITGEAPIHYYASATSGPLFACAANAGRACAWGAIKAILGLARVPVDKRPPVVRRALAQGGAFLLSCDPLTCLYPTPDDGPPNRSWFRLGFPSGYVADVLQNLEALCELGFGADPRLHAAFRWLLSKQDKYGRWRNEYAYNGKTWVDFEPQGAPSKWVTLRACRALKLASSS